MARRPKESSTKEQTVRKLSPQERAIEKVRPDYEIHGWDLEEYASQISFDSLSDEEWKPVWSHVVAASGKKMVAEEARIRDLVDDAAYSSGWFIGFGYCDPQPSDFRQRAKEGVTFLKKVKSFRIAAAEYFGEPDGDPAERYDLWPERRILPVIRRIERRVELQINYWEDWDAGGSTLWTVSSG